MLNNYLNEDLSKLVSDGDLISDEVRLKMESAWRSYLSRQKKKTKIITISSSTYSDAKIAAEAKGMTVREYIEDLIGRPVEKPLRKPLKQRNLSASLSQQFTKYDGKI